MYGLIGETLAHSYSKEIHESLGKYEYRLHSLSREEMPEFIRSRKFRGLNVTIPYKKEVIPLCDGISELAKRIGAVNTLYWKDGKLIGHNTDYEGFLYNAKRAGISFAGKKVLILGNGGTSLTARNAVLDSGASEIYIASRSAGKEAEGGTFRMVSYEELPGLAPEIQIVVNTTPVGTYPNNLQQVISLKDFPGCEAAVDVIYNPFKTKLLLEAEELGLRFANGLPMLVAQATAAAGYFLGTPGAFEGENERIISAMESRMKNIVLVGMPGCGKSTVGRLLAELTGKKLIDMDAEIEKEAGMRIPRIFDTEGESGFRDRETEAALRLGKERGVILATGGGAVLRQKNVEALRQNGLVIHIRRPLETLETSGRPLSKDREALEKMQRERMPLYEKAADMTFDNSVSCSEAALKEKLAEQFAAK